MKTKVEKQREKEWSAIEGTRIFSVINVVADSTVKTDFIDLNGVLFKLKLDLISMANHVDVPQMTIITVRRKDEYDQVHQ
jgi:hypothetical protein